MFDKLYKEANDEIPVNMLLMEKLKKEAAGGKKKKSYGFMYRYGFAAAAIVIMVVSLNVMPEMEKTQKEQDKYPGTKPRIVTENAVLMGKETSPSSANDETGMTVPENEVINPAEIPNGENTGNFSQFSMTDNAVADTQVAEPTKESTAESVPAENNEKSVSKTGNEKSTAENSSAVQNTVGSTQHAEVTADATAEVKEDVTAENNKVSPAPVEESVVTKPESAQTEAEQKDSETAPMAEMKRSSGGGGGSSGGSSAAAFYSDNNRISNLREPEPVYEITLDEYCEAFGFNPDIWEIPSGMSMVNSGKLYFKSNEPEAIPYTLIFSGAEETVYVQMFPESGDVAPLIESGNGEMYNGSLILENSETSYTAYIVKNGNGYIVETNKIEKENVYSLIDSIR